MCSFWFFPVGDLFLHVKLRDLRHNIIYNTPINTTVNSRVRVECVSVL